MVEYFRLIMNDQRKGELQVALDLLDHGNETYFFSRAQALRVPALQQVLPHAAPAKCFGVWSAASSSVKSPTAWR